MRSFFIDLTTPNNFSVKSVVCICKLESNGLMKKTFSLLILGAILEYYDFAIYIFFAKNIGTSLIPIHNEVLNLIAMFAIFAIGALIRPIGGLIFAYVGDTNGRRKSFTYTILLMSVPTLLIAFIPSYGTIGVWATIILLILRSIQGFAIGGEIPASIIFAYELSRKKSRALNTNIVVAGTNIGLLLASLICVNLLSIKLSFDTWRIAFFIGGIFGIISFFLRKKLNESPEFIKLQQIKLIQQSPLKSLLVNHRVALWQMTSFGCLCACLVAIFTIFMPNYLSTFYNISLKQAMSLNSYSMLIFISAALFAGKFDYLLGKKFLISSTILFNIVNVWLFTHYSTISFSTIEIIHLSILIYIGIICGRFPILVASFFPANVRYTGVALSYNISFGIVAGLSQIILISLIKFSNYLWLPAVYVGLFSIPALVFLITIRPQQLYNYQ